MSIAIRTAQPEDLKQISFIETVCFPASEAADEKKIKSRIQKFPEHFLVLTENQKIIGFINGLVCDSPVLSDDMFENAELHQESGAYQMILSLAVSPEYQHKGYGKKLLKAMTASAKLQNRRGVTLTCKEQLVPFYAESGFVNQGRSASVHGGFEWYEMRMLF